MNLKILQFGILRPPAILLRPVRPESVEFAEMLDSIRDHGLWQPLLVRPAGDGYEVVDGHYRYACCKLLRVRDVPCIVRELTDEEVLLAQLQANGVRLETTPVEFSERLNILMENNPDLTISKLAVMIRKSPSWIRKVLRLRKLNAAAQAKLKDGRIPVQSAYELAVLPLLVQQGFIEAAEKLPVADFLVQIRAERKRLREHAQQHHILDHLVNQDKPIPFLRTVLDIKEEYASPRRAGPVLIKADAKTPMDGWRACLAWILHMDTDGLIDQEKMIASRQGVRLRAEERRKKERQQLRELREAAVSTTSQHPRIEL